MTHSPSRILILMSDAGGGHRSSAEAIADAIAHEFPQRYHVLIEDAIARNAVFPFNRLGTIYFFGVMYTRELYAFLFHWTNNPHRSRLVLQMIDWVLGTRMKNFFRDHSFDLILSVHPLLTTVPRRLLRSIGSHAPFVTVVTDLFDTHRLWYDPETDLCLVPTQVARMHALMLRVPEPQVQVVGLPVSLEFISNGQNKTKQEWRAHLGLRPEQTTALLVGGGEGMGDLYEIAREIAAAQLPLQLVIITGRNKRLQKKLEETQWEIPVHIEGFVKNMPEWMRASDVLVTKAGPSTICEALACGLPMVLSGYLPGQEEGNVSFVVEGGVGVLREQPEEIAGTLKEWLTPGNDTLARFAAHTHELARPRAAVDIAKILDEMIRKDGG